MHLIVVGLNYKTAPVEVRERFALAEQELPKALRILGQTTSILEGVVVATCNRTEIYAVVDRPYLCGHYVRAFMEQWFQIPRKEFTPYLYMYEDDQAIAHLFRVACGLDSMIVGETQILGQVRDAFLLAQQLKVTGTLFNRLFKQAVTFAKRAHSETSIGESAVSVSYAAVELGKRIFGRFDNKRVMIIGAGKMSELTAQHLHANGAKEIDVVNRTYEKAEELAGKFGGQAMTMETAIGLLGKVDIVISSTGASGFVLTRSMLEKAMGERKKRPLFLIDIAVPRDIDPSCGQLSNVFLYDIDDLEGIVESNLAKRRKEAKLIEDRIAAELDDYRQWYATLGVKPLIQALQEKAAEVHTQTLDNLLRKLPDLDERELKVITKLTKSMVNQLMHDPIRRVKELSAGKRSNESMAMFTELFALEDRVAELKAEEKASMAARREKEAFPLYMADAAESAPPKLDVDGLLTKLANALR